MEEDKEGKRTLLYCKAWCFRLNLAALSNFFEVPWNTPASGLTEKDKAGVLSWAGFGLRALSRLRDATDPMKAGVKDYAHRA